MNIAKRWRKLLGVQLINAYAQNDKVAAGLIAGSVGRGWEDRHSDLDLFVFWDSPPTERDRREAVARTGGVIDVDWANPPATDAYRNLVAARNGLIGQMWPYELDEWSEHYYVHGVNIGISGFLVSTVDRYLHELNEELDPNDDKEIVISAVQSGLAVQGHKQIEVWRRQAADYPKALSATLVERQLAYEDSWSACQVYADRGVTTLFSDLTNKMVNKIARILLAVNRIYLPDPRIKWLEKLLPDMTITPLDLAIRLKRLNDLTPEDIIQEMTVIFLETLDLIDMHLPQTDTGYARQWIHYRRPVFTAAPDGVRLK